MKQLTSEWVEKAEADYDTAVTRMVAGKLSSYDIVCYHCQQCVEKYLKARLQESDIPVRKTHDLLLLLDTVVQVEPLWDPLRDSLDFLSASASGVRYPGVTTTKDVAERTLQIASQVRRLAREAFGLTD